MDRVVLITGASGGIGAAIARGFAAQGARLALGWHRNEVAARALQAELEALGAKVLLCQADVAEEADVEVMFGTAEVAFGPVEVLVNAAGHAGQKLATEITKAEWDRMLAVHAGGSFLCCRRALGPMIAQKSGCIVNISSMWGQVGASCEVHYSAAKAAVIGLTKALAKEVGPCGIRVNCVAPGAIETPMMAGFTEVETAALCEDTPLGRLGSPDEVAGAVLYLASGAAGFVTGQVLAPNGGFVV